MKTFLFSVIVLSFSGPHHYRVQEISTSKIVDYISPDTLHVGDTVLISLNYNILDKSRKNKH